MTDKIDLLVDKLGCSIAEAQQIIADDKAIDQGKRMSFDLTKEDEKQAKKLCNVPDKKPTVYTWDTKERKKNVNKEAIITELTQCLINLGYEQVSPVNNQKTIRFMYKELIFSLDLIQATKKTYDKVKKEIEDYQKKNEHSSI